MYKAILVSIMIATTLLAVLVVNSYTPSKLEISVDLGKEYSGVVNVVMNTPQGVFLKSFVLKHGTIKKIIDVSEPVREWDQWYRQHRRQEYKHVAWLPYLYVWLYVVDHKGNSYYYSSSYGPVQYYLRKGYKYSKAVQLAVNNPLEAYSGTIKINIIHPKLFLMNDLYNSFEKFLIKRKVINHEKPVLKPTNDDYYTSVIYEDLYNAQNNPPSDWNNRLESNYLDNNTKSMIWKYIATTYSVKYYFKKSSFTLDEVTAWANDYLGPQGFMSMETLVNRIAHKFGIYSGVIDWIDTYPDGFDLYLNLTIAGMGATYFDTSQPIQSELEYSAFLYAYYVHGWTFLGHFVSPYNTTLLGQIQETARLSKESKHYVYIEAVNADIHFVYDSMLLQWRITSETVNGVDYWVVTPYPVFTPYYYVYWDPINIKKHYTNQKPDIVGNLEWASEGAVLFDRYINNNYKPYPNEPMVLYTEKESLSGRYYSSFTSVSAGIYLTLLNMFIQKLGASSLLSFIISMASSVGYGYINCYASGIQITYTVIKGDDLTGDVHMVITKNVFKAYNVNDLPLVIEFSLQIGDPSLPPGPNNPQNNTSTSR